MSDLVSPVIEAIKATELDCACWPDETLRELAQAAIIGVRMYDARRRPDPTPDKINEAFKRAARR
jgi:hypothetical protein